MKLLLVLLVLACRELIAAEWRDVLTKPARAWRDAMLESALTRQLSSGLLLVLIAGVPAALTAALLALTTDVGVAWQYVLALIVAVPVFSDRVLPPVLVHYRQQWLEQDIIDKAQDQLLPARRQLLTAYLQELVSPLFWLLLLGSWGVVVLVVYYYLRLCARLSHDLLLAEQAGRWQALLDWLPSRVLALSFALAGRFVETWVYWQGNISNTAIPAAEFIDAAAAQAEHLDNYPVEPMALVTTLAAYEALCYRSIMIWLILLSLHMIF